MSATLHISEKGMIPTFFAPDVDICDVMDHYTKEADNSCGQRNALVESARLARSCIKPLCECEACNYGALILPGGFGVVRTLLVNDTHSNINSSSSYFSYIVLLIDRLIDLFIFFIL